MEEFSHLNLNPQREGIYFDDGNENGVEISTDLHVSQSEMDGYFLRRRAKVKHSPHLEY